MFWQSIATLLEGYRISITVQKNENGTLTAMIIPKANKDTKATLAPIVLTGTPEEFDSPEIVTTIKEALVITKDKFVNVKMFIAGLEALEKKKKEEVEKKKTSSSSSKKTEPKKPMKKIPNPAYVKPEDRDSAKEDLDSEEGGYPEGYDEEFIEVEDETGVQKQLI